MKRIRSVRIHCLLVTAGLVAALALPGGAGAQLTKGQKILGVHVGLSGVGSAASVGVSGEVAYNSRISIGGWLDTWSYGQSYRSGTESANWSVRYVAIAGTGAFHFPIESNPKWDPFVGLALGYYVVNSSTSSSLGADYSYSGSSSRLFLGGFGGARYYFKPNLAGMARVGFGSSYLTVGLDFRM